MPRKKKNKKRSAGGNPELQVDDLELEDADEAILSSLQDIANLEYDEDEDDEDEEDDGDEIAVSTEGLTRAPVPAVSGKVVQDEALRDRNVHVIPDHEISTRDKEIEFLREELRKTAEENAANQKIVAKLRSDLEVAKRRHQRDQAELMEKTLSATIKEFLPIQDSLGRGLENCKPIPGTEAFYEGFALTRNLFDKVLRVMEVTPVESWHRPFDPRFMESMGTTPSNEFPPNTVVTEHQRGYLFRGRILRPAIVLISKPGSPGAEPHPVTAQQAAPVPGPAPDTAAEPAIQPEASNETRQEEPPNSGEPLAPSEPSQLS